MVEAVAMWVATVAKVVRVVAGLLEAMAALVTAVSAVVALLAGGMEAKWGMAALLAAKVPLAALPVAKGSQEGRSSRTWATRCDSGRARPPCRA